jgi:serine/threonine-protein kinase
VPTGIENYLSAGTMLDDKYRIERLLAAGSMGEVYLGTHTLLRKRVAIKILNPELSSAPMIERFHREAINASQIGHEGIAQVTDIGTSREGEPFLVMEYLEGESLASRLHALGPLAVEDACELGCAILSPLGAAHHAGIVHRDLKPDNVFLVRQSRGEMVKLLDFGISRAPGLASEFRLTSTGLVLGTPYYMSPEQARGESQITPAADLYAFGVMLYEMLAGDVPIRADNYNQLMYRVMTGEFARPRERRPDLPEGLEQLILHAMALSPKVRPASALELEEALLSFCRPVFREHTSGRISAPGLMRKTTPHPGSHPRDIALDPRLFAGPTIQDSTQDSTTNAPLLSPDDADPGDADPDPRRTIRIRSTAARGAVSPDGEGASWQSAPDAAVAEASAPTPALHVPRLTETETETKTEEDQRSLTTQATRRSRARWIPIGMAGTVAAGALVLTLASRGEPSVPATPALAPPSPAPAVVHTTEGTGESQTVPVAPVGPATITLRFAVQPSAAVITLDGTRLNGSELVVHKDAAPHRLRITAAGYLGHEETISFDESQRLVVQLMHVASPTQGKDPRKDRSRTERTERIESRSPYE